VEEMMYKTWLLYVEIVMGKKQQVKICKIIYKIK
jgi:hypothetical protein